MSAAKIQSVSGNGATLVLNGVVANNALIYVSAYHRSPSTGAVEATPTDSNGTFVVSSADAPAILSGLDIGASIFHEQGAAAGTHTVTPQANTIHNCSLTEFSGLLTSGMFDVAKSANSVAGNQTSQVTGTTLTTAQADELEVIGLAILQSAGGNPIGLTDPVAGTTTLKIDQNTATDIGDQQAFKNLSSTGTKSETFNWTTTDPITGSFGCIATFKAAASATDNLAALFLTRGGRGPGKGPSARRLAPQRFPDSPILATETSQFQSPMFRPRRLLWPNRRLPQRFPDSLATTTILVSTIGAWAWSGAPANLTKILTEGVGAWSWLGVAALVPRLVAATPGPYTWTGKTSPISKSIASLKGTYSWAGVASPLSKSLAPVPGGYTWAGTAATFASPSTITEAVGAWSWAGRQSTFATLIQESIGRVTWAGSHSNVSFPGAVSTSGMYPIPGRRTRR